MSDGNLRELERAWSESGAVDAEAAFLRAQVRHGELAPTRLALAAYLGHEPAILAGEIPGAYRDRATARYPSPGMARTLATHPKPAVHPANQAGLVRGLVEWGDDATLRAAATGAWLALPVFEGGVEEPARVAAGDALRRLQAWISDPSGNAAEVVTALDLTLAAVPLPPEPDLLDGLGDSVLPFWDLDLPDETSRDIPFVFGWSLQVEYAFRALEAACEATRRPAHRDSLTVEAVWMASLATSYDAVLSRVEADLIAWALGMEPPELRVKADDVFGDVTPYRKGREP